VSGPLCGDELDGQARAGAVLGTDDGLAVQRRVGVERDSRAGRRLRGQLRGVHELEREDGRVPGGQVVHEGDGPGQRPTVGRRGVRAGGVVGQVLRVEQQRRAGRAAVDLCGAVVAEVVQGGQGSRVAVELRGDVDRVVADVLVGDRQRLPDVREHVAPVDVHVVDAGPTSGLESDAVAGDGAGDGAGAGVAEVGVGGTDGEDAAADRDQQRHDEGDYTSPVTRVVGLGTAHGRAFLCSGAVKACGRSRHRTKLSLWIT